MAECEMLPQCGFFHDRMGKAPATAERLKKVYCLAGDPTCARYMVRIALGKGAAPSDLFPNDQPRALAILEQAGIKA